MKQLNFTQVQKDDQQFYLLALEKKTAVGMSIGGVVGAGIAGFCHAKALMVGAIILGGVALGGAVVAGLGELQKKKEKQVEAKQE